LIHAPGLPSGRIRREKMSKRSGGRFSAFLFGGLLGMITGLAFAPRSGSETRERWKEKGEDLKEKAEELKQKAQELIEKAEDAWESSEEWRKQALERAAELKVKSQELGRKAASEAENLSEELKTRFADITSRFKGIQKDIEKVALEEGEEAGVKAGVALSALKERLHEARDSFREAMHAKEKELKERIDDAVEAEGKKAAGKKKGTKKTALKKTSSKKEGEGGGAGKE